jgi:hypothetical protein
MMSSSRPFNEQNLFKVVIGASPLKPLIVHRCFPEPDSGATRHPEESVQLGGRRATSESSMQRRRSCRICLKPAFYDRPLPGYV